VLSSSVLLYLIFVKETVRKVAATLLSRCLSLVANHDKVPNPQIFTYILVEAQKGITNSSSDVIQGSLLIYRELLMSTNMFMEEHFADTCEKILSLRQHKVSISPLRAHININSIGCGSQENCDESIARLRPI
jgi:FKBP12-rapamycin complex-associated protein